MRSVSPHHSRASRRRSPNQYTPLGIMRAGEGAVVFAASFNAFASSALIEACRTQQRIKGILCFLEAINGFWWNWARFRGFEYALPVLLSSPRPLCRNAIAVLN